MVKAIRGAWKVPLTNAQQTRTPTPPVDGHRASNGLPRVIACHSGGPMGTTPLPRPPMTGANTDSVTEGQGESVRGV